MSSWVLGSLSSPWMVLSHLLLLQWWFASPLPSVMVALTPIFFGMANNNPRRSALCSGQSNSSWANRFWFDLGQRKCFRICGEKIYDQTKRIAIVITYQERVNSNYGCNDDCPIIGIICLFLLFRS